jgi:hypothetical protein
VQTKQAPARQTIKHTPDAAVLGVGLPVRRESPVEFWISMMQMIPPLNVKMGYLIQKGANTAKIVPAADARDATRAKLLAGAEVCEHCAGSGQVIVEHGSLGAEARNKILQTALDEKTPYVLFFDDDVLFPDMSAYRLWVQAQKHPEAAAISAVYTTKVTPCEPLIYQDDVSGADWNWALGTLRTIHSAGAGAQIVNMSYVRKLEPPWFNDVVKDVDGKQKGHYRRHTWGHDRFFHMRLRDEAGGVIYADTGLLCAHWDIETQRAYVIPPDAPCFQRPPEGEAFFAMLDADGVVTWHRAMGAAAGDPDFIGYLDWREQGRTNAGTKVELIAKKAKKK